jgi:hypothetical protein
MATELSHKIQAPHDNASAGLRAGIAWRRFRRTSRLVLHRPREQLWRIIVKDAPSAKVVEERRRIRLLSQPSDDR